MPGSQSTLLLFSGVLEASEMPLLRARLPGDFRASGCSCRGQGQCGEEKQVHSARARYGARRQQDWRSRYRNAELLGEHPEWQGHVAVADEIAQSLGHGFYFWPLEKECRKRGFCYNKACPFATVRQP